MSLINQMLQDLEKRRASGAERGALPSQVRVLPLAESHGLLWKVLGAAAIVVVTAALGWHFGARDTTPRVAEPVSPRQSDGQSDVQVATSTLEPGAPASRLALELERVPTVTPKRPAAVASVPVLNEASKAPPPVAAVKTVQAPPATAAVVAADPVAAKTEAPKPVAAANEARPASQPAVAAKPPAAPRPAETVPEAKAPPAAGSAQIDKRMQVMTPQQLAENDYREATNFLNQGRLADAQDGFRRALQHSPAHAGARQGLFGLLLDAKKNAEAEQVLKDGLKLNPNQPALAIALSSLQFERGDTGEAIETLQRTAPAAQASPEYIARLAGMLQRQSRHREAVEQYQAVLRLAPQAGVWWMGLGISLQALARNAEAQDAFRRARSSNSLSAELQGFVDQRLRQLQ
jgi:MSHA biogenesis protein MshN